MTDEDQRRQRLAPAPQSRLPNWMLVAVAGAVTAAALPARSVI